MTTVNWKADSAGSSWLDIKQLTEKFEAISRNSWTPSVWVWTLFRLSSIEASAARLSRSREVTNYPQDFFLLFEVPARAEVWVFQLVPLTFPTFPPSRGECQKKRMNSATSLMLCDSGMVFLRQFSGGYSIGCTNHDDQDDRPPNGLIRSA